MGDCPNDVRESEISPDATVLKRALDAKLETGKPKILLHVLERQIPSRGGYRFRALKCMKSS